MRYAWSCVLRRQPTDSERELALRYLTTQTRTFTQSQNPAIDEAATRLTADVRSSLVLHLRADNAVIADADDARVRSVPDLSGQGHDATQLDAKAQPVLRTDGFAGKPTLYFDGRSRFMHLSGQILNAQPHTIVCVVSDDGGSGHREVISNWNGGAGNATTSLFLGLTGDDAVRFSDAFAPAGNVADRTKPFVLTAVNGSDQAFVFQNGRLLQSAAVLPSRRLDTAWVIGQQGNIQGEFWNGDIAEIRVYDRGLSDQERRSVEEQLAERYDISLCPVDNPVRLRPEILALASLCHALMNSNEFVYID
ncbi:MAG: hypothetical protein R3C05_01990 [Pirellulaceae bacterium]